MWLFRKDKRMKTLKALVEEDHARVIDVRTRSEYEVSHFPDAENIPIDELPHRLESLKQETRPLVLYCRSGVRSGVGVNFLHQHGLPSVHNGGGLDDMMRLTKY